MLDTLVALQIIAGIEPAWLHWDTFFSKPRPERRPDEGLIHWRNRCEFEVKSAACAHVAQRLEALQA